MMNLLNIKASKAGAYACIFFIMCFFSANGQKFEITPQYGYQVGAKWNYYGGYVKMKSSDQYGITLNANLGGDVQAEFFWSQQNSSIAVKDVIYFPREEEVTDVQVNHFQFGVIHTFGYSDAVPFFGMSAGWSTFNPDRAIYDSTTKFTLGVSGGLKYFFTDRIGLRMQAQLLMPIQWGGVYVGPGGSGVTAGGALVIFNFSGGLVIAI
jgi:hypothetical protein